MDTKSLIVGGIIAYFLFGKKGCGCESPTVVSNGGATVPPPGSQCGNPSPWHQQIGQGSTPYTGICAMYSVAQVIGNRNAFQAPDWQPADACSTAPAVEAGLIYSAQDVQTYNIPAGLNLPFPRF